VYDFVFGAMIDAGRRDAVNIINRRRGSVLEVGVGTGLSLGRYRPDLKITGIDLSPAMLAKAEAKVAREKLTNVKDILAMDAADLKFPDGSFDTVVAMYVLTVVPDPEKVMAELERVCKPDGEIIIVSHFVKPTRNRGWVDHLVAPVARKLGWRSDFHIGAVMTRDCLRLVERRLLNPFRLFTLLRFVRQAEPVGNQPLLDEEFVEQMRSDPGGAPYPV
ncbi:MAG: class I SAM-dependent methyltransferase, partial [Fimbriimonadaceae bacterium]|nr:class I SAM-dependent methyltransferase [Alphaproteobacteria bacterium]